MSSHLDARSSSLRLLAESTLHKENMLENGHSAVWGSFWEPLPNIAGSPGRWGYACCRMCMRHARCPLAPPEKRQPETILAEKQKHECREFPVHSAFAGSPVAFADNIIKWLLREWRLRLVDCDCCEKCASPEFTVHELFRNPSELERAEREARPLLQLLPHAEARARKVKSKVQILGEREDWHCSHCQYLNIGDRVQCRKCKRDDEYFQEPDEFPQFEATLAKSVGRIAIMIGEREYLAASEAFLELSVGHGRWHSDTLAGNPVGVGGAPTRKARAAQGHMRRQAEALAPLDSMEISRSLTCFKRLITLAQLFCGNTDLSKNQAVSYDVEQARLEARLEAEARLYDAVRD